MFPSMQFYQLANRARFEFRGKQYQKTAMSMAQDADRNGNVFQGETEVSPTGDRFCCPLNRQQSGSPLIFHMDGLHYAFTDRPPKEVQTWALGFVPPTLAMLVWRRPEDRTSNEALHEFGLVDQAPLVSCTKRCGSV